MARWGEEDKKSKGIFGCAFAFLVLGLTCYTFYINYQNLEGRRKLEKAMHQIVEGGGYSQEAPEMTARILKAAEELGLEVTPDQIEITREWDDNHNPVVDAYIDFTFTVNLLGYTFEMSLPIYEHVTIVVF